MTDEDRRGGGRRGGWLGSALLLVGGILGLIALAAVSVSVVAMVQSRGMVAESRRVETSVPAALRDVDAPVDAEGGVDAAERPGVLQLRVVSARLVLTPVEAGEPIGVEADFDPRYYELQQREETTDDGRWLYRVRFAPSGNHVMAILRMKLGTALPTLRVRLPRDVALEFDGDVRAGFAAIELGGTAVRGVDMFVGGGAGTISFLEPLERPMGRLVMSGDTGSIEITGLGNASPAEAIIEHSLGEIDLDLRGAWRRDASITLDVSMAGGGVWLPRHVTFEGLPGAHGRIRSDVDAPTDELAPPHLSFDVTEGAGRLVFID